jgi:hypothetical protein
MKYLLLISILLLNIRVSGETFGSATDTSGLGMSGTTIVNAIMNSHPNQSYTASAGDVVTKFSFFGEGDGGSPDEIDVALYDITSGDTTIVGSAETITLSNAPSAWYHSDAVSIPLTAGNTYCMAFGDERNYVATWKANGVDGNSENTGTALNSPWTHNADIGRYHAMYVTYTPGAAGGWAGQVIKVQQQ